MSLTMALPRVVAPEALDHLAASDPAAQQSRRDLARIHGMMATQGIVARAWQRLVPPARAQAPLRVLELGAGDGTLLLGVARRLAPAWPQVQLTLLDRQPVVSAATLAVYARLGWAATVQTADVLDWAAATDEPAHTGPPWDLVSCSLFLHHFEGAALDALLAAVAARALRFVACEPRRSAFALAGSHLVFALGANAVTRADAVLSVHAGFNGRDISQRWPAASDWRCQENAAGLFSHCFSGQRAGVL